MGWQDPFEVVENKGEVDYVNSIPRKGHHLYHVNLY